MHMSGCVCRCERVCRSEPLCGCGCVLCDSTMNFSRCCFIYDFYLNSLFSVCFYL